MSHTVMHMFKLLVIMVAASYFAESLLVSALVTHSRLFEIQNISFLHNRYANATVPPTGFKRTSCTPCLVNPSTRHAIPSFGYTKWVGLTRSMSYRGDKIPDVVRRLPTPSETARVASDTPDIVLRVARQPIRSNSVDPPIRCKPWLVDWCSVIEAAGDVYFNLGDGCSERMYQEALLHALYIMNVPVLIERPVYAMNGGMTVMKGRIDLEIARRFILELKVSAPTTANLRKDKKQLRRYISAYNDNGVRLERAALVYFGNGEVRVVEVPVGNEVVCI